MNEHPIQPLERDEKDVLRFKKNAIVEYLLDKGGLSLNDIAVGQFSQNDQEQFAQLIGYSLSGFGELSYVRDETYAVASKMAAADITEEEARGICQKQLLDDVRKHVKPIAALLFRIHPDDLEE